MSISDKQCVPATGSRHGHNQNYIHLTPNTHPECDITH